MASFAARRKQTYIDALKMMYDLLNKARKDGLTALEPMSRNQRRVPSSRKIQLS